MAGSLHLRSFLFGIKEVLPYNGIALSSNRRADPFRGPVLHPRSAPFTCLPSHCRHKGAFLFSGSSRSVPSTLLNHCKSGRKKKGMKAVVGFPRLCM